MCLVFVAYKMSPRYRWVLAGNRDEFHARPTAELSCLNKQKSLIGGQDLQAGGMWLGATKDGKIGVITNYRDGGAVAIPGQPSRGAIVRRYLESDDTALQAMERLAEKGEDYAGFNVIFGDRKQLVYFSNRQKMITPLSPGFYGLSNRFLDSDWPKVRRGKSLLQDLMCDIARVDEDEILKKLQDRRVPADDSLPDTGVGLELERFLSPMMIVGDNYGTRSSAVVSLDSDGVIEFVEKSYLRSGVGELITSQKKICL